MFVTQFLFVYLVYILAFVGAVLMLFLSVVLMLPISTLNYSSASVMTLLLQSVHTPLRPPGVDL
jgi:NADH:ubiquinone oxidoreductase subunit 6 (subunit J)